jgi:hypothetical protein
MLSEMSDFSLQTIPMSSAKCARCRKLPRFDRPSSSLYCDNCMIHTCPTCGQTVKYVSNSNTWFCDKCNKNAEPTPHLIAEYQIDGKIRDLLTFYETDFTVAFLGETAHAGSIFPRGRGRLRFGPAHLSYIERGKTLYNIKREQIIDAQSYVDTKRKLFAAVSSFDIAGVVGVIGADTTAASHAAAATNHNVLDFTFLDEKGARLRLKFAPQNVHPYSLAEAIKNYKIRTYEQEIDDLKKNLPPS